MVSPLRLRATSQWLLAFALLVALVAIFFRFSFRKQHVCDLWKNLDSIVFSWSWSSVLNLLCFQRIWTMEELAMYNGTDEGLPILLGILGLFFLLCFSLFIWIFDQAYMIVLYTLQFLNFDCFDGKQLCLWRN